MEENYPCGHAKTRKNSYVRIRCKCHRRAKCSNPQRVTYEEWRCKGCMRESTLIPSRNRVRAIKGTQPRAGYLYLIRASKWPALVKFGFTANLPERMSNLRRVYGDIELLGYKEGTSFEEADLRAATREQRPARWGAAGKPPHHTEFRSNEGPVRVFHESLIQPPGEFRLWGNLEDAA